MIIDYDNEETTAELQLLSGLISNKGPGQYEAMTIVKDYEEYFENHINFGLRLRQYVGDKKLLGIEASHIDRGSKHWVYKLHGGVKSAD